MSNKKKEEPILSLSDFMEFFPTKVSGARCFEKFAWGDKVKCNKCGSSNRITPQKDGVHYWCGDCRGYFTVFLHTPLERSVIDPRRWLYIAYVLLTSKNGVSIQQLSKELNSKPTTVWHMLHRIGIVSNTDNNIK